MAEQAIATRRCALWCTLKDGVYTPLSLESTYVVPDDLAEALEANGFTVINVEVYIWGKVIIPE